MSAVDYLKFSRLRAILMEQLEKLMQTIDIYFGDELGLYTHLAGHPTVVFPRKFEKDHGFLVPRHQFMAGRAYDESTLLALADAYQRAVGLNERPPLEKFLAEHQPTVVLIARRYLLPPSCRRRGRSRWQPRLAI